MSVMVLSCDALLPCLDGDGDIVSEERLGGAFYEIEADGSYNVIVEKGPTAVIVTTDDNLQRYIETTISGGKLTIETSNETCIDFSEETKVLIRTPDLKGITLLGSGNIEANGFNSVQNFNVSQVGTGNIRLSGLIVNSEIEVNLVGSGNIWMNGKALNAKYKLSGSGTIEAESFPVQYCTINLSGSGNIHTYVHDLLNILLSGSGNVYYYGNPEEVNEHNVGKGSIVKR